MDYVIGFYIGNGPQLHEERIHDCANATEAMEKLYAIQDEAEIAESLLGVPAIYPVQ